jgi:hypothetical protein
MVASLHKCARPPERRGKALIGPSIYTLRPGTHILEPGPSPDRRYRLMMRVPGGIDHVSGTHYDLTAANALYLLVCAPSSALGLTPEAISALTSSER